jgi:2-dehydro-3-deoxyphosphogluconate aldolase/(4S)-4-hydroxy-2-oxoglutarate aldolase
MRSKQQIIEQLLNPGVIAVVRAKRAEQAVPLAEALVAGGVIAVEITMTTPERHRRHQVKRAQSWATAR